MLGRKLLQNFGGYSYFHGKLDAAFPLPDPARSVYTNLRCGIIVDKSREINRS